MRGPRQHKPLHAKMMGAPELRQHRSLPELKGEVGPARYDREVRARTPWMQWYRTSEWRRLRAAVLQREPRCRACGAEARVVDHVKPHRGDRALFLDPANLQALCDGCHKRKTARDGSRHAHRGGRT